MSGRPSEDCIKREFNKEQVEFSSTISVLFFFAQVDCITDTLLNREDWRRLCKFTSYLSCFTLYSNCLAVMF